MAERCDHVGMGQCGTDDEADTGACQAKKQRDENADRNEQHEQAVCGIIEALPGEGGDIQGGGNVVRDRHLAPYHLHHFFDDEGEAKGKQQFRHMAEAVHRTQRITFHCRAEYTDQDGSCDEAGPETNMIGDLIGKIGAQHEETGMGKIQHPHHAENQREAARQQEQQHPVKDAVKE